MRSSGLPEGRIAVGRHNAQPQAGLSTPVMSEQKLFTKALSSSPRRSSCISPTAAPSRGITRVEAGANVVALSGATVMPSRAPTWQRMLVQLDDSWAIVGVTPSLSSGCRRSPQLSVGTGRTARPAGPRRVVMPDQRVGGQTGQRQGKFRLRWLSTRCRALARHP